MGMLPKRTLLLTRNSSIFEIPKFANENYAESRIFFGFVFFPQTVLALEGFLLLL